MSEMESVAPAGTAKPKRAPAEIKLEDFATLIARMNRLLVGLTMLPPFKNASIGLVEWATLSHLVERDGIGNKQLAKSLGVTGQRANQIGTSLLKHGFVTVRSSETDNRRNVINITEAGRKQLSTVNSQLMPLLAESLKNRERVLTTTMRQVKIVMRVLQTEKTPEDKKNKKNKKAAATA